MLLGKLSEKESFTSYPIESLLMPKNGNVTVPSDQKASQTACIILVD
jgi:hypothetical protein